MRTSIVVEVEIFPSIKVWECGDKCCQNFAWPFTALLDCGCIHGPTIKKDGVHRHEFWPDIGDEISHNCPERTNS